MLLWSLPSIKEINLTLKKINNFYTWLWKVLLPPESGESLNWNIYSLREPVRTVRTRSWSFCSEWFPYHHKLTLLFSLCWKYMLCFPQASLTLGRRTEMLSQVQCLPQTARKLGTKVTPTLFHYILSQSTFSFHPDTPVISIFNAWQ